MTAKPVAGLRPNVACEFKRAGFLEWRNDWNIAAEPKPDHLFCRARVSEKPSFKKGSAVFRVEVGKPR
jgi:hypothetical protein